ncbi:MAG: hypothetical protein RBT34_13305 [Anaerolineaceae bacterium]|jgi:hypothetical protein|nr:hypothetical protein [Anaerolineaceae bacterium]
MDRKFTPKDILDSALRLWWFVAAVMLLGAAAGWTFHRIRPAVYEGRASLATGIDYVRTGPLNDLEEDQAMELVGDVIKADDTRQAALALAESQGIRIPNALFVESSYLERQNYTWILRVRHADPAAAAILTNAWLEAAYTGLEEAYRHALIAEGLLQYSQSLTRCLENSISSEPVQALCAAQNLAEIQEELLAVNDAKTAELLASRGLFPAMAFTIVERASIPSSPAAYQRNTLVFSGAMLGFVLGVWLISSGLAEKYVTRADKRGKSV